MSNYLYGSVGYHGLRLISHVALQAPSLLDPVAVSDGGWCVRTNLTTISSLHALLANLTSRKN